jgi:hypothetical protein
VSRVLFPHGLQLIITMDGITHIATEATTTAIATTGIIIGIGLGLLGHGRIIAIGKRWVCAVRWLRLHHFLKSLLCSMQFRALTAISTD